MVIKQVPTLDCSQPLDDQLHFLKLFGPTSNQLSMVAMVLELADGTIYQGYSFGVQKKSISRECVFQTESSTDFLYKGQILALTYPLIGSCSVPERNDNLLSNHLESSCIHVSALVTGSYSGEVKPGSFDGLFISNGPSDPKLAEDTIQRIRQATEMKEFSNFGICLGHQLLALAVGAKTLKLKYGNWGQNITCNNLQSGQCYISSQNHGYTVDTQSLPKGWKQLFVNANDQSNKGIYSPQHPYFSAQLHPESAAGPQDTKFLFDIFLQSVIACLQDGSFLPVTMPGGSHFENSLKNPRVLVKKVLAIKGLKQEGVYTILINPNIATIQTTKRLDDKVYFFPITPEFVRKVLGTPISTIVMTEDQELFANSMAKIGKKCVMSASATSANNSIDAANKSGYPVILQAAYALGGLGSGFANNEEELVDLFGKAFSISSQVLIEQSMKGWKEVEYEMVCDCCNICITICNMENFDPLGIHTRDFIVVAPLQTLSDEDNHMLQTMAIILVCHLGVVVKMPRWDLKKFQQVSSRLGSSMKSVGEVMAIGRNFEEAIQKAIRSADPSFTGFDKNHIVTDKELKNELMNPADCCIFAIANAFDTNQTLDEVWELQKLTSEFGIRPFVKQIDTVAAEFLAFTNYLFNTYNIVKHHVTFKDWGIIVLGSGVYRIGSSAEFDWCAVRAICTLRGRGPRAVMINYIPETFSTNFDKANCLYFKNISVKTILDIYDAKKSSGVMISKAKENTISCSFWKG
ncbi:hypothetical protein PPACK8108_LOCUS22161 [Phakopsora pachyrhizi]|uniref:ATP-grasp domain-containing protein n=1 Tax=Phakopsora pachyrhizi TaxID=170000 RepID=A0AAV0BN16_PHAPC|nr:hypothetical protein PPACK8108_LOCUS22161 [Phakopsora pachyrhizi]